MPWEPGGRSTEEVGTHLDIARKGEELFILSCSSVQEVTTQTNALQACWGFSKEELKDAQAADTSLSFVIAWLKNKEEPARSGNIFGRSIS